MSDATRSQSQGVARKEFTTRVQQFWEEHPENAACAIVQRAMSSAVTQHNRSRTNHHLIIRFWHEAPLGESKTADLREQLESIDWQFITLQKPRAVGPFCFGIAPMLFADSTLGTAYHATRSSVIRRIRDGESLLPSNPDRSATGFPDTEGRICCCEKLEGEARDNAVWWMNHLREQNQSDESEYGILKIDLTALPSGAVLHRDMHSESGWIIERLNGIPRCALEEIQMPDWI